MSKSKETKEETIEERFLRYLERVPPADAMIMLAGAVAGYHGWTPVTALINMVGVGTMRDLGHAMQAGQKAKTPVWFNIAVGLGFIGRKEAIEMARSEEMMEAAKHKALMAIVGLIEAYAITRPGAIAGIAGMVDAVTPFT